MFFSTHLFRGKAISCALILCISTVELQANTDVQLEEILVTAEFIETSADQLANSVTVIDQSQIELRSAKHLEGLLALAPNVNFATGASRGRFIQIRGVGERSEFQEPLINSVGVVLDGIDLTGIATAATTLDIAQVEILRGPQGTLYGANALAGLINLVSAKPSRTPFNQLSLGVEEYGGRELGGVMSGPLSDSMAYRVAVKNYRSDGFVRNEFLQREDTNKIDETTFRAKLNAQVSDRLQVTGTIFYADIDNGYDAFSLDNNRTTYSDQPGRDSQETIAGALVVDFVLNESLSLEALLSTAQSDLEYSYDEDWSHLGICEGTACDSALFGFDWFYSSFDQYIRDNENQTLDLRLVSAQSETVSWVAGFYARRQEVGLHRRYTFAESDFSSTLETDNVAAYGQIEWALNDQWSVSGGLRLESRDVDYRDNLGVSAAPDESLWGGKLALKYQPEEGGLFYGLISRGYKPGGFNLDQDIDASRREFDTETMINYELGYKNRFLDQRLAIQATAFIQQRDDIQSKQSIVRSIATGELGGLCPCSFTDFTDNATSGTNQGIEVSLNWRWSERASLFASLGLLESEFDDFLTFEHLLANREAGVAYNLKDREQAHAPSYQWALGGEVFLLPNLSLSGSIEAKDKYYFSERHDERSDSYQLINLQLSYQTEDWELTLYGKNLTDEVVKTRGFGSFGNDPRKFYELEPYNQFAAPRIVGIRAKINF